MPKLPQRELDRLIDAAMDHAQKEIGGPGASVQAGYDAMEATGAYFRFNNVAWPKTLELATFYGWEPEHDEQYYLPKGNQVVSAEDANNLAAALERAVAGLSQIVSMHRSHDVLPLGQVLPEQILPELERLGLNFEGLGVNAVGPRKDLEPIAFWANNPDQLRRFLRFARQGAFQID